MVLAHEWIILLLLIAATNVDGKIYEKCELARELRNFDLPEDELPTWVCIAEYESNFNTGAMNFGSGDHGLFQISEIYWCSPPGYGCNVPCSKFRDEDISDDLQCIRRIHNEHSRISGDGFNAWVVYPLFCKNITHDYIQDCFDDNSTAISNEISTTDEQDGDGYNFPALPNNKDDNGDGYEFPKLPTRGQKALTFYNLQKFPANKVSIHHSVSVPKYDFRKFPGPKGSIHDFIPVKQSLSKTLSDSIQTNPFLNGKFSKTSIYDSVSLESTLENEVSTSSVASRSGISKSIQGKAFLTSTSTAKPQTSTAFSRTSSTSKNPSSTSYKSAKSSVPIETSTKLSSFSTRLPLSTTHEASTTSISQTTSKPQSKTIPRLTSTTQKSTAKISTRGSFAVDSRHLKATTTSKPSTTTIGTSSTTLKPSTTTIKTSSFAKLSTTSKKPSTTTSKFQPATTPTSKPFATFSRTTNADLEAASSTFIPRSTSKPFSHFSTTITPSARQVTFAPDSWFNWLFNSQTLPPLVAPPRPGNRPEGSGGPPRPSAPPALRPTPGGGLNGNFSTTRRPLPRPTHLQQSGNGSTTRRPRPTHLQTGFNSTTRRPLPRPTHHLQPGSSTPVALEVATTRRPLPTHLQPSGSSTVITKPPVAVLGVEFSTTRRPLPRPPGPQLNVDRVTRRPLPMHWQHPPRRRPSAHKDDDGNSYKEVAIDEHVVYLRSKYGFQLFRV